MKVTALKKFGKYQPGEEFEFPDRAAMVFIKMGKFRAVQAPAADTKSLSAPRGRAEQPAATDAAQTYLTRDLQAQ